jgi:hypothetical protein
MKVLRNGEKFRIFTGTAAPLDVLFDYADLATGVDIFGARFAVTASGLTDLLLGPASGGRRVKMLSITNNDASITYVGILQRFDGTNAGVVKRLTLAPSEQMVMNEDGVWQHFDALGRVLVQGYEGPAGGVASVNGETGTVVLTSDDVDDSGDANKFTSAAEIAKLAGIEAGAEVNDVFSVAGKTGAVALVKGDVGLGNVDNTSDVNKPISTATQSALDGKQASLGFTAENAANKGVAGGYAGLDGSGKVPAAQLPSFVDDVLEAANFAALPGTGETGKIYVTLDDNKSWRWSGSAYVEISASPGSTDAVSEGATNLYFTVARVLATVLAGISFASSATITAADTVLSALGKLQAQLTAHVGAGGAAHSDATTSVAGFQSGADKTKLDGVASGATANDTNANLRDRTTHTGAQAIATVTGLQAALDAKSATGHTHTTGDITSLAEFIRDTIAAFLVQGSNITLTHDDPSDTLTITAAGGGGGSGDVVGPASATDNALARFDTTTGKLLQNSGVTLDDNGVLTLPEATTPATPAAGKVALFIRNMAGRLLPSLVGPSGLDTTLQPHFGRNQIAYWRAAGNSTTITAEGAAALTATGTATAANAATTNLQTMMRRLEYLVTVAATTAVAGFRGAAAMWSVGGTAAGRGGFHLNCIWGPATGVATATSRAFCGMTNATGAPTDVEPSSITNIVGMGWDAADTNIQIMHRGAGAVTKIDLGASFPVPTADRTEVYELALFAPSGTTQTVGYRVTNLTTGVSASGTISTNMPTTGTFLAPRGWMSVGGTSSVIGVALMNLYLESDY